MTSKAVETQRTAQTFVAAATKVTMAAGADEFFDSLKEGYLCLHSRLTADENGAHAKALRRAFSETRHNPQVRMALEMCAMPIYEKPLLPTGDTANPEFLWIFALPIVIRFPEEVCSEGPFVWEDSPLPAEEILGLFKNSPRFEPRAALRMFTNLYTRSDILSWGPENMALHVVNAEISDSECPFPLPLQFSADLSGYRSVMLFALCAARLPIGVKSLFQPHPARADLDAIEHLIGKRLTAMNVSFEEVTVAPPCPMTSSCFVSNPAFLQQVSEICEASKLAWDLKSVYVKFPMPGYVELAGRLESGNEVVLMPAELCCEPRKNVSETIERIARAAGMNVTAPTVSLFSRAANVH